MMNESTVEKVGRYLELSPARWSEAARVSIDLVSSRLQDRLISVCQVIYPHTPVDELELHDHTFDVASICQGRVVAVLNDPPFLLKDRISITSIISHKEITSLTSYEDGWRFSFGPEVFMSRDLFLHDDSWARFIRELRSSLSVVGSVSYSEEELAERSELQRLLKKYPDMISAYGPRA